MSGGLDVHSYSILSYGHPNILPVRWLKQQKCIASHVWMLEVQDQGVRRVGFS